METIAKFTVENWIGIAAIVTVYIGWLGKLHLWLWSWFKRNILDKKIEVITPSFEHRFASLNPQTKACPFLDKNGHLSLESLLDNHQALFKKNAEIAGKLRSNNVYIKCYKVDDSSGGTTLVSSKEHVTNLMGTSNNPQFSINPANEQRP